MEQIKASDTLTIEVDAGADPHVAVIRDSGGLVRIEPGELRALIGALVEAAGRLGEGPAGTSGGDVCAGYPMER